MIHEFDCRSPVQPNPWLQRVKFVRRAWLTSLSLFVAIIFLSTAQAQQSALSSNGDESVLAGTYRFDKYGGIRYLQVDEIALECDVYVPHGDQTFPAILAVHGGAWRSGSKLNLFRHARYLANAGYVVVVINYRHAPTHKFPAQIEDCKAAIAWMRKHADDYKIDPNRIGAWGYSAGGHLVSMLGVTNDNDCFDHALPNDLSEFDTRVSAVVAAGAPCDLGWIPDDSYTLAFWLGGSRNDDPEVYQRATPMNYVTRDAPPFYFYHGTNDKLVPVRGSKDFHNELQLAGVRSIFVEYQGAGHFDMFNDMQALKESIKFFDEHLKSSNKVKPAGDQ